MKKINLKKFPLLDRGGNAVETDIEDIFLNTSYANSQTRDDVVTNLSFKKGEDIELNEVNTAYLRRYLEHLNPATILYSFDKYLENEDSME